VFGFFNNYDLGHSAGITVDTEVSHSLPGQVVNSKAHFWNCSVVTHLSEYSVWYPSPPRFCIVYVVVLGVVSIAVPS